jgi:hypothetical protein
MGVDDTVYAEPLVLRVCLPIGAQREMVLSTINKLRPTRAREGWTIMQDPTPCDADGTRQHWLLSW